MGWNDVRGMSEATRAILTAPEVIAIDQDPGGRQGRRIGGDAHGEVWARELGWPADALVAVRDLWLRQDLGAFAWGFETTVEPHDVVFLRVKR